MIVLKYQKSNHKNIIQACVHALRQGKVVAFPTDTSYGLAVDATNIRAVKKLYRVKGRDFKKPVHVVVADQIVAKKIAHWEKSAEKLSKQFWPGAVTLVLPLTSKASSWKILSAKSGFIGLRMPKNNIALDLANILNRPVTATSANLAGQPDCYSAKEISGQFETEKYRPDIIIDSGKLPKRKPSTVVKIDKGEIEILRQGPVSENKIKKILNLKS
jgi:L-threonylcarbamoyladenylate synthase